MSNLAAGVEDAGPSINLLADAPVPAKPLKNQGPANSPALRQGLLHFTEM
jgi:hypothetical protein